MDPYNFLRPITKDRANLNEKSFFFL